MSDGSDEGEPRPPHDHAGCALLALRVGCGMALLQILMATAILIAALVSLFFFR